MASDEDIKRAETYVSRINDYPTSTGAAGALAEQFAQVRAEERAAMQEECCEVHDMSEAAGYDAGKREERAATIAKVVAWLRGRNETVNTKYNWADAIEAGEHEEGS